MEDIMGDLQKFLSTAPVLIMALLTVTAGILIEFNRFYPDLLFHPLS
jgi:photosystem I subunit 9